VFFFDSADNYGLKYMKIRVVDIADLIEANRH